MADSKLSALRSTSPFVAPMAAGDLLYLVQDVSTTPDERAMTKTELVTAINSSLVWKVHRLIVDPQGVYTKRAQVPLFRAEAAITITRIYLDCNDHTPTAEFAGDLKFADDIADGGFANPVVIDVCDTTNGVFTATSSFDDATVPSGKFVYLSMDAAPHADIDEIYLEVYYTVD